MAAISLLTLTLEPLGMSPLVDERNRFPLAHTAKQMAAISLLTLTLEPPLVDEPNLVPPVSHSQTKWPPSPYLPSHLNPWYEMSPNRFPLAHTAKQNGRHLPTYHHT
jgi:hypothetical protein